MPKAMGKGDECGGCCHFMGSCARCWGGKFIVLGLLILANVYYLMWNWWTFIAALLILKGLVKLAWPHCPHC